MMKKAKLLKAGILSDEVEFLLYDDSFENKKGYVLNEYLKEHEDLIIQSDKDFKINENPKYTKTLTKPVEFKTVLETNNLSLKCGSDESNVLRVECRYNSKSTSHELCRENITCETEVNDCNNYDSGTDLKKLLVMMALTSQIESPNEEITPRNENYTTNEIMEFERSDVKLIPLPHNCEDINDILYIAPIRIELTDRHKRLMQKYIQKWKKYVNKKKEFWSQQRQNTLNTFLDKLKKKKVEINESSESVNKVKLLAKDYSTYQHRYKVQKHIIALQKAKLEEQTRLIEELKYNKIVEASKQSVDTMRDEVRRAYYEIDRNLKPKIKCLTNELKIPEIDHSSLVLQCLKVPQFLQRMEKRAREREEKHAMIRERRKQMEEERVRLKQQAELAKIEMDKEEKNKRLKELRDKRKKEKIENIRRKLFAERMRALVVMAELHYEKCLMAKYGIRPLKRLIEMKHDYIEKARAHYKFQLKKNVFYHFMWYTEDMVFERNYKSQEFYRKKVLAKVFRGFKQMHYEYVCKRQVAEDYYDLYVTQLMFRKLREATDQLKKEYKMKLIRASAYYYSNLLFKIFTCWRSLPALNELQRQQESRKARWRQKVLLVVPDYTPPDD